MNATQLGRAVASRAVTVNLSIGYPGSGARDSRGETVVDREYGSKNAGRFTKHRIDPQWLEPIRKHAGKTRNTFLARTVPLVGTKDRLLPNRQHFEFAEWFRGRSHEFDAIARQLSDDWPNEVRRAEQRLRDLYRSADYPNDISDQFYCDLRVRPMADPGQAVSELFGSAAQSIQEEMERENQRAAEHAIKESCERMVESLSHMRERVEAYDKREPGSKSGSFHNTLVTNAQQCVELAQGFDLSGDGILTETIAKAKALVNNLTPDSLRESPTVRADVMAQADEILARMNSYTKGN